MPFRGHIPQLMNRPTWFGFHHVAMTERMVAPKAEPSARPICAPTLKLLDEDWLLELEALDEGLAVAPAVVPVRDPAGVADSGKGGDVDEPDAGLDESHRSTEYAAIEPFELL
jgi:hypothetical protein